MSNHIKAMAFLPRGKYFTTQVLDELWVYQAFVGGYIEVVRMYEKGLENVVLVVNEEGLLRNLAENDTLPDYCLRGNALAVGTDGEEFRSLTNKEISILERMCA